MRDEDVTAALACASKLLDTWRLQGIPLPAWLVRHHGRMQALSARGTRSGTGTTSLGHEPALNSQDVAVMLNVSTRWVRKHADKLGGVKTGRDWVFDRRAVLEHDEGRRS